MLSELERTILEAISYDESEPLEFVDRIIEENSELSPEQGLELLLKLFREGFVKIRQTPIEAMGQKFASKNLVPETAMDITGDLKKAFLKYAEERRYLNSIDGTGVPFGIYISLTPAGKQQVS